MSDLLVTWESLGVAAQTSWTDSDYFVSIAHGIISLRADAFPIFEDFEEPGIEGVGTIVDDGIQTMRTALADAGDTLNSVSLELSDACAALGSGTESAMANFDATEAEATVDLNFIQSRLEAQEEL